MVRQNIVRLDVTFASGSPSIRLPCVPLCTSSTIILIYWNSLPMTACYNGTICIKYICLFHGKCGVIRLSPTIDVKGYFFVVDVVVNPTSYMVFVSVNSRYCDSFKQNYSGYTVDFTKKLLRRDTLILL